MKDYDTFPSSIHEKLGYYVYRLINPTNGENFYVGKGTGNRVFDHINATKESIKKIKDEDSDSLKIKQIKEIHNSGLKVIHVIHRHNMSHEIAKEVEAALIDAYPGLTNVILGKGSNDYGPRNVKQIINTYQLEEIPCFDEKCLIIKVNKSLEEYDLYDATRYAWRLDVNRAKKVDYIISVMYGVVKNVYVAEKWLKATKENFPGFPVSNFENPRYGFIGHEAPDNIKNKYNNKQIPKDYCKKGASNPILYANV